MEIACKKWIEVLHFCDITLRDNFDFMKDLIDSHPGALRILSQDFISQNPEFVQSKFTAYCRYERADIQLTYRSYRSLAKTMQPWLTTRDDFASAWFEAGLPLVTNSDHPWKADKEKLLLVAERCPDARSRRESFRGLSVALANDDDFIRQVMRFDPNLFSFAPRRIREDSFDLAMIALSSAPSNSFGLNLPVIERYKNRAWESVDLHKSFFNPFLCALQFPSDQSLASRLLSELNKLELKLLIADFLGVPRGEHLAHIRAALPNLMRAHGGRRRPGSIRGGNLIP